MRAAFGSEEALREEFRESMVVVMINRFLDGQFGLAFRTLVF